MRSPVATEGLELLKQGRLEAASALCAKYPDDPNSFHLLGLIALARREWETAESLLRKAISANPAAAKFRYALGQVYTATSRFEAAAEAYRMTLRLSPTLVGAWLRLGAALDHLGRKDEAIEAITNCLKVDPENVAAWVALGKSALSQRRHVEAGDALRRALQVDPDSAPAHDCWGRLMQQEHRYGEAEKHHRLAIGLTGDMTAPYVGLAQCLFAQGRLKEAADSFRQALALAPDDQAICSDLLFTLLHDPEVSAFDAYSEHLVWDRQFGTPAGPGGFNNDKTADRRLKIGYVSPDFWDHPVAFFFSPVLQAHDPAAVEVFCYAHVAAPDSRTKELRDRADHWRDIAGQCDEDVAALIREDKIDVLVEMAGHTGGRLGVFARRPAPIQIEWLGYMGGCGLSALNGRITDPLADPQDLLEADPMIRLPSSFLATDPKTVKAPVPPPCLDAGYVTFGSFNKLAKINDRVVACMARILRQVPESRILIKCSEMDDPGLQDRMRERFKAHGVEGARVETIGYTHRPEEHLAHFNRVDILLDAFPWNGVTTTINALSRGKPVVSLAEPDRPCRVTASFLINLGLEELLARSEAEYVDKAVSLADNPARIKSLTMGMADRMKASPLTDVAGFTRELENAYRDLWRKWCET